jgi:hypothetical protein
MELYAVRITEDPKNPKPKLDYENFISQLGSDEIAFWDKDVKNKLKKGDYLGFIVGEASSAKIYIYKISEEKDISCREVSWSKNIGYTKSSIENIPKYRQVIGFEYQIPVIYSWKKWKIDVGYHSRFFPRATQKIKAPQEILNLLVF